MMNTTVINAQARLDDQRRLRALLIEGRTFWVGQRLIAQGQEELFEVRIEIETFDVLLAECDQRISQLTQA